MSSSSVVPMDLEESENGEDQAITTAQQESLDNHGGVHVHVLWIFFSCKERERARVEKQMETAIFLSI